MTLWTIGARILLVSQLLICATGVVAAPAVVGFIAPDEEPRFTNLVEGLRQGLQAAGMGAEIVVILEHRVERGDAAGALRAARSLTTGDARVAFVVGTELTKLVRSATRDLPIVFITPGDPVRAGIATTLGHPGNNLTGMTFEFSELSAKRLELLKEISPSARRVGVVYDARDNSPRQGFAAAKVGATRLGIQLVELDVVRLGRGAIITMQGDKLDGLLLIPGGAISNVIDVAMKLAATQRIAAVAWNRNEATREAVISYGVNDVEVARSASED